MQNINNRERFNVTYRLIGNEKEALLKAQDICIEQTVEFPEDLINNNFIRNTVFGKIESFNKIENKTYHAIISFDVEITAYELTQLINVIFGNISLKPGIFVEKINLSEKLLEHFKGPRFGVEGIRKLLNIYNRPLLATAVKPMGMSPEDLADIAYKFAKGGIDIIKDDHGLSNQSFACFEKRVKLCIEAVNKANSETNHNTIFIPNITSSFDSLYNLANKAKNMGAGGLLIAPGLTGFDAARFLSECNDLNLPVIGHPSFIGSYLTGNNGLSYYFLFGQLMKLAGVDAIIYPNYGGRFSFSKEQCLDIIRGTKEKYSNIKPIFPMPGGGMSLDNIPEMSKIYGNDVIYLIGGGLFKSGNNLIENCQYFRKIIENSF